MFFSAEGAPWVPSCITLSKQVLSCLLWSLILQSQWERAGLGDPAQNYCVTLERALPWYLSSQGFCHLNSFCTLVSLSVWAPSLLFPNDYFLSCIRFFREVCGSPLYFRAGRNGSTEERQPFFSTKKSSPQSLLSSPKFWTLWWFLDAPTNSLTLLQSRGGV